MLPRRPQQGFVLVAILAALLLAASYFMFHSLNFAAVRVDRDRVTNEALAKAKEALIAYAVADSNRPGELPCPDVNDDGKLVIGEDLIGSACASRIGRLPWITLGLPDLRDDAGERLWYALSNDFHANGTVALNSDTAYRAGNTSLRILGNAGLPASPDGVVVAIVFSPGAALRRTDGTSQVRGCTVGVNCDATLKCTTSPASNTPKCNPVNYLDIASGEDNADLLPAANPQFITAAQSDTFNDRLKPIYSDDIMGLVQRRAGREFAQHLRDHYDTWASPPAVAGTSFNSFKGYYPWAAPLNDPSALAPGVNGTPNGQLPLSTASIRWNTPTASIGLCSGANTTQIQCTATSLFGILTVNGSVQNVATAFVDPPSAANVNVAGLAFGSTITWTFNAAAQTLDFQWSAMLLGLVTVTARVPQASAWTASSWLLDNDWNQNAFYAVAPAYAFNGGNACGQCITVNNTASPASKQAIVLMTGRALAGQATRPIAAPAAVTQFLENANATATPASLVFESNVQSTTFNDYPIVVRP